MRGFSAAVKAIFATGEIIPIYLIKIIAPTESIYDCTGRSQITLSGIGTFTPNNGLNIVEPPKLSPSVDREAYKITYADPQFNKRSLFELNLTGAPVTTYVTFYNTTGSVLNGIEPGQPLTAAEDVIIAYEGVVDTRGYSVDPEQGTVIAVVECSSPMASLGRTRAFYTSKDAMMQVDPTDTSFDQVYLGMSKVTHLWGKA
jgi:hypothetical protein